MIWSGALMLDFLGQGDERYRSAHDGILRAMEEVIASGPKTRDLGGSASTQEVGKAIAAAL
ncbi:Tartrate dehydrogenase/decarboxylase [compost metagenome]